jgi:hypothetical protein
MLQLNCTIYLLVALTSASCVIEDLVTSEHLHIVQICIRWHEQSQQVPFNNLI